MAKSSTSFPPGKSGNPTGRPKLDKEIQKLKSLTPNEWARILYTNIHLTDEELEKKLSGPLPALEKVFIQILIRGAEFGDQKRIDWILSRIPEIGPITTQVSLSVARPYVLESHDGKEKIICGVEEDET